MNHGEILTKAWKIIWKHKILWLFGVLAGCSATGSGGDGGGGGGGAANSVNMQPGTLDFLNPQLQRNLEDFGRTVAEIPVWVWITAAIALVVIGFLLSILFLLIGILGETSVIKGTSMADEAELDAPPMRLSAIIKAIKPHYWKVFLFNLGFRLVGFFVVLFLWVPIILLTLCTCCLGLFLLVPIGWFIRMMVNFTTIAIIEEDKGIFEAISRAWQVITRNLGAVLAMFLILGVGALLVGLVISLPLFIIPVPLVANLFISGFQSITVGLILSGLLSMLFVPLLIFLAGVLRAYILASWTLTFRRLTLVDELQPTVLNDQSGEV